MRKLLTLAAIAAMTCCALEARAATPAFSVHKNGTDQTVTASTNVMLTWSTEVFDTNNNFASNRFTPTEAGKYLIVVSVRCAQPGMCIPSIYKNGTLYAQTQWTNHGFGDQTPQATAIIDMNGSGDYVEAFIYSTGTVIGGTSDRTYFSGSQVDRGGGGTLSATGLTLEVNSNTSRPDVAMHRSRGTTGAKTAIQLGDILGVIGTMGYGASTYGANGYNTAIISQAAENFTDTAMGTHLSFGTTPVGSNTRAEAMRITSTGNVGIGTTTPASDLEIEKTVAGGGVYAEINNLSTANNSLTQLVLRNGTTGSSNTGIQNNQGAGIPYSVFFTGAGVTGGMYLDVLANAPLVFRTNAGTERMRITGAGNVGIGTPTPERWMHMAVAEPRIRMQDTAAVGSAATGFIEFHDSAGTRTGFVGDASSSNSHISIRSDNGSVLAVAGANTCTYTSGASWSCSSDARMKDNIEPLFDSLKKIVQLQGVTYRWRDPNKSEAVHVGLIAQDVQRIFPEVVTINDDDGMLQLDYAALVAPLVEAVKELKAANDDLKAESDALRTELRETIRSQDAEIEVLRRKIKAVAATR